MLKKVFMQQTLQMKKKRKFFCHPVSIPPSFLITGVRITTLEPTCQMRVKFRLGGYQKNLTRQPECFVFPLFTDSSSLDPELFSDLASKNSEKLTSVASVFKKLIKNPASLGCLLVQGSLDDF
jgi:hypothetical protein